MQVDEWPICSKCGDDFQYSNEYVFPDGTRLCRDCFDKKRAEMDEQGIKYFFKHIPGSAWPNTADVFAYLTEEDLKEKINALYGKNVKTICRSGSRHVMLILENGGWWCIGYTSQNMTELPEMHVVDGEAVCK